ncbi:MAG: hypothetical protein HOP16_08325 [Acidobacteria bacterium]|nr:hypothetical protein [Acidobacteriota bacterium]
MANVNVTLAEEATTPEHRTFPCPLCSAQLELRESRSNKPYCVCNTCGLQIFFRGKVGISRLGKLLEERDRIIGRGMAIASPAIATFERVEQLRAHKNELQRRRSLIFADDDLEHTISAVDREIASLQLLLEQMSGTSTG